MKLLMQLLSGIGGSVPDHWRGYRERADPDMTRFGPSDRDRTELAGWCEALNRAAVLVAHGLACLMLAHWTGRSGTRIVGPMLVAEPDPAGSAFPDEPQSFALR
jgi:predicted alpha/beta hydrolase family esterase